jgi:hypothetical protein
LTAPASQAQAEDKRTLVLYSEGGRVMSLSEHDLQVLAELEHDFGNPSAVTRLYLLIQAARVAWHGLLLPAVALAAGAGLLTAGALAGAVVGALAKELMIMAGIAAICYAAYAAAVAWPPSHRSRKRA